MSDLPRPVERLPESRDQLQAIVNGLEQRLSPSVLIGVTPLAGLDSESADILRKSVDAAFEDSPEAKALVARVRDAATRFRQATEGLSIEWDGNAPQAGSRRSLEGAVAAAEELREVLLRLPVGPLLI